MQGLLTPTTTGGAEGDELLPFGFPAGWVLVEEQEGRDPVEQEGDGQDDEDGDGCLLHL